MEVTNQENGFTLPIFTLPEHILRDTFKFRPDQLRCILCRDSAPLVFSMQSVPHALEPQTPRMCLRDADGQSVVLYDGSNLFYKYFFGWVPVSSAPGKEDCACCSGCFTKISEKFRQAVFETFQSDGHLTNRSSTYVGFSRAPSVIVYAERDVPVLTF